MPSVLNAVIVVFASIVVLLFLLWVGKGIYAKKIPLAVKIATVILISTFVFILLLFLGGAIYQNHWVSEAESRVVTTAESIANGESVEHLEFSEFLNRDEFARDLKSGFRIDRFDNIGLGFQAYEIFICVKDGDQYRFDAVHYDDVWNLSCCSYLAQSKWCLETN